MGKLAYALLMSTEWGVDVQTGTGHGRIDWSAAISAHYLIIILINQNNKSYFNPGFSDVKNNIS